MNHISYVHVHRVRL